MAKKNSIPTIPVDADLGEMLGCAVRYALGRRTYVVSDVCNFIMPLIPKLDERTICCMERDIIEQRRFGYGDECDEADWLRLLAVLTAEIDLRGIKHWEALGLPRSP